MKTTTKKEVQRNGRWIGSWIETKTKSTIVVCICGNKYIKTREGQILCLKCSSISAVKLSK